MQYFRTLIYIYIQGRYFLSPAQRKADYRSHNSMCKMHNKKCVPLNPKQLDQNNCYLHLSTVTLLSLFQVAISTFPSTIHPFGVWHVGQTHPSTRLQVLLQLLSVALVEHLGKWVPEYGRGRKNMRTGLGNGSENQKRSTGNPDKGYRPLPEILGVVLKQIVISCACTTPEDKVRLHCRMV